MSVFDLSARIWALMKSPTNFNPWQNRSLGEVYPILYLEVLQFKVEVVLNRFAIVYENQAAG